MATRGRLEYDGGNVGGVDSIKCEECDRNEDSRRSDDLCGSYGGGGDDSRF
jgi:hypothetical protein